MIRGHHAARIRIPTAALFLKQTFALCPARSPVSHRYSAGKQNRKKNTVNTGRRLFIYGPGTETDQVHVSRFQRLYLARR
jgi:hypothetical protein